ncbi:hypothetical protein [Novosphingobium gossypii]|uniref:hypothetical protein n=1 Tax=Novosphingobium gossypii TaxID=1604774 RepID=UPI003D25B1AF
MTKDVNPSTTPRGTFGDARPDDENDSRTKGAQKPEKVEDRPLVNEVDPEDYPQQERKDGDLTR